MVKDWNEFKREFDTEPKYTRRQLSEELAKLEKSLTVNRVIMHVGGDQKNQIALQILAIHRTSEGIVIVVS